MKTSPVQFCDVALERVALSTIIQRPVALTDALDILTVDDFHDDAHAHIYAAIKQTAHEGKTPDAPAVYATLSDKGLFQKSQQAFAEVLKTSPTVNHRDVIVRLKNLADKQRLYTYTERIQQQLINPSITAEAIAAEMSTETPRPKPRTLEAFTAADLMRMDFPDVQWVVDNVLPVGCCLMVGAPKVGKSWLALDLCLTFASGGLMLGGTQVQAGEALYVSLEDTPRRLHSRIRKQGASPTDKAHFVTAWPQGEAGIAALHSWMKQHPTTKMIIVDTLARFWGGGDLNDYSQALTPVARLKDIADTYGIAVIIIHHARKNETSSDFMNMTLGSQALNGTADATLILTKKRNTGEGKLSLTGRDVADREIALRFNTDNCRWESLGEAAQVAESGARQEIIDLLRESGEALSPKEIAESLGKNGNTTRVILSRMLKSGLIEKLEISGRYRAVNAVNSVNAVNAVNSVNSVNELSFQG